MAHLYDFQCKIARYCDGNRHLRGQKQLCSGFFENQVVIFA